MNNPTPGLFNLETTVGKFAGFELRVIKQKAEYTGHVTGAQSYKFNVYPENTTYMVNHIIGVVEGIDNKVKVWTENLAETKTDLAAQEKMIAEPFAKQAELEQKTARFNEVMAILNPKEEQVIGDDNEEDTQYQAREYLSVEASEFANEIDEWDSNGRPEGETFILGSTGNVIQGLGAIESDVYMLSDKINNIFTEHPEMTVKEIKSIPEILENPVLVLASQNAWKASENTRLVVFGMVKAQNGLPVMAVFDLRPRENKIYLSDMQKVASAYTKDNSPQATMELIKNSNVLYADKNKTTSLLHSVGFQHAYSVEQSGYVGNISYVDKTVNVQGKKFSDVFPDTQYQERTSPLTDREVLSIAASDVKVDGLDEGEQDALRIFQQRLESLYELEQKRAEEGQRYKEQQFGKNVDREAAAKTLERMKVLDSQISKASADVLKVEKTEVLKRVLQKARKLVETKEREHGQELLKRYRDRRNNAAAIKKYRERIRTDVDSLTKWIIHPNNKNAYQHVPDALKNSVIPFLASIDFSSKRKLSGGAATVADKEFMRRLQKLKKAIKQNIDIQGMYSGYSDLPEGFMDELQKFIDSAQVLAESQEGQFVINRMTSDELKILSKLVRVVKKLITNMNAFHQNAMFQHTYDAGDSSIEFMSKLETKTEMGKREEQVSEFLLWQQIRPAYAFERFGEGGMSIYDEFRRAQATLAFNTIKIKEFAEKAYTDAEVEEWEKKTETFDLGGDTVKIPVSYLMGFYELSKQKDSLEHILGDGLRVANYETKKGRKTVKISDVGHALTPADVSEMVTRLQEKYPKAIEVADKLQKFMATQGAEWGNYVTVARWASLRTKFSIRLCPSICGSMPFSRKIITASYSIDN